MANFKIGTKYLTYANTKYFMKGANFVEIGHFGRKQDAMGSFDPDFLVSNIQELTQGLVPNSSVKVYTMKKTSGGGLLKFREITDTVKAEIEARGSSTKVIVGEIDFFDVLGGPLVQLVKNDPNCMSSLDDPGKKCVVDSVAQVKSLRSITAAELTVDVDVKVKIQEVLDGTIGVDVENMSYQDLVISSGTVLAYRLIHVRKKNGGLAHKRDNPEL